MDAFDAIVVGARCAGSATAIGLARAGARVLLVDRAAFPSDTLSTHVFGDWEVIDRLGVRDEILAAGAPPLTRFRTEIDGCALEADLAVAPFVVGLRREKLDAILLRRAASHPGVEVRPETTVTDLLWTDGAARGVVLRQRGGAAHAARARVLIGADGARSLVARAVGAETYLEGAETRCAYYAYYADVAPSPVPTFEFRWHGADLILLNPCDGGLHCAVVMPPQEEFSRWRRDPAVLDDRLRRVPTLAPRLRDARRIGPVRGSGTLRSFLRTPYGPGWALVGDAGACIHPCVGAGIDNALASAEMLTASLRRWLEGEASWDAAMADYHRQRDARVRPTLESALRLAERPPVPPEAVQWLKVLCTFPGVAYLAAARADEVVALLVGAERARQLRDLVPPTEVALAG